MPAFEHEALPGRVLFGVGAGTLFAAAMAQIYSDLTGPAHAEVFS